METQARWVWPWECDCYGVCADPFRGPRTAQNVTIHEKGIFPSWLDCYNATEEDCRADESYADRVECLNLFRRRTNNCVGRCLLEERSVLVLDGPLRSGVECVKQTLEECHVHGGTFEHADFGTSEQIGASRPGALLVQPVEGQLIAGELVGWQAVARASAPRAFFPTLEYSLDGRAWEPWEGEYGGELGPDAVRGFLDATFFPSGPLLLRVRDGAQVSRPVRVAVGHLPEAICNVAQAGPLRVVIDCSPSRDPDGEVAGVRVHYGDGTTEEQPVGEPFRHTYETVADYAVDIEVFDDSGLVMPLFKFLRFDLEGGLFPPDPDNLMCHCLRMDIRTKGWSELFALENTPVALGLAKVNFRFEVSSLLTPGSDPDVCTEGQEVRGTYKMNGDDPGHKKACSSGRRQPICTEHADCHQHICRGGLRDGVTCDGALALAACKAGGGQEVRCVSLDNGICTEYPWNGEARGNDDYRQHSPGDLGWKQRIPNRLLPLIVWYDAPGWEGHGGAVDQRYEADFIAFMRGSDPGPADDCQCHFRVLLDWQRDRRPNVPGDQPGWNPDPNIVSGLTVVRDAETFNCP